MVLRNSYWNEDRQKPHSVPFNSIVYKSNCSTISIIQDKYDIDGKNGAYYDDIDDGSLDFNFVKKASLLSVFCALL